MKWKLWASIRVEIYDANLDNGDKITQVIFKNWSTI